MAYLVIIQIISNGWVVTSCVLCYVFLFVCANKAFIVLIVAIVMLILISNSINNGILIFQNLLVEDSMIKLDRICQEAN